MHHTRSEWIPLEKNMMIQSPWALHARQATTISLWNMDPQFNLAEAQEESDLTLQGTYNFVKIDGSLRTPPPTSNVLVPAHIHHPPSLVPPHDRMLPSSPSPSMPTNRNIPYLDFFATSC